MNTFWIILHKFHVSFSFMFLVIKSKNKTWVFATSTYSTTKRVHPVYVNVFVSCNSGLWETDQVWVKYINQNIFHIQLYLPEMDTLKFCFEWIRKIFRLLYKYVTKFNIRRIYQLNEQLMLVIRRRWYSDLERGNETLRQLCVDGSVM